MDRLSPFQSYNLSSGLVSFVADDLLPSSAATLSINLHYDVVGKATSRYGTYRVGAPVSGGDSCDGLGQYISSDKTKNSLVAAFGGTNYAFDGISWSSIGGGMTAGIPVRYTSFWDKLYRVGGGASTAVWNGSGSFSAVSGAPSGKYITPYKQRLYIAGDSSYPNRLWFSTIADFNGSFSFDTTSSSEQYIDFTQGKANDVITGLGKISNLLIVFLDNAMYRWNGNSTDAEIVVDVGCSSQDSIVNAKGLLYFFNPTGFYSTDGTYPQEISRPIYDWIQSINPANYSKIYGGQDADHVYWYVGDVTLTSPNRDFKMATGRTFKNVVLVYTISSRNWQVYSYANNLRYFATYVDSNNVVSLVSGDADGNVLKLNSDTTDHGGYPINYEWESKEEFFDSRATTKQINKMAWFMDNGAGAQVMVGADNGILRTIGAVTGRVTIFPSVDVKGHFFRFGLKGSNTSTPVSFSGFEVYDITIHGYINYG